MLSQWLLYECYKLLVMQYKAMLKKEGWEFKLLHGWREANHVADKLSSLGIDRDVGIIFFSSLPKKVMHILNTNVVGVNWPKNSI